MTGRKLAAHVRRVMGELDRRDALRAAVDAMRAVRAESESINPIARRMLEDAATRSLLRQDDALGVIGQALSAPALEQAYRATTTERRKFTEAEIPSVTQLFTPRWVIEFLLQSSLGKMWVEMHPKSKLRKRWKWIVDPPREQACDKRSAESIRVLDPACGTMNFGIVAIEMLREMYREEDSARSSAWIDDAIVRNNLVGMDIDPVALEFADATLRFMLKGKRQIDLRSMDALFDPCESKFDVIATNPPYLSARNLSRDLVARMKKRYPHSWRDQYACFIERAIELLDDRGRVAMLTMHSFMFTAAFESLRAKIDRTTAIEAIAHFGPGLFDVGNPGTLQTVAFLLRRESDSTRRDMQTVSAIRLVDDDDKQSALAGPDRVHRLLQRNLRSSPRGAWCYWLTARQRQIFATLPKLAEIAPPRQGLATTDNARFVRYWWEVESRADAPCQPSPDTWFPYVKSGRNRRWYEAPQHRVNWRNDGEEIKAAIVTRYPYLEGQWQWVAKNVQHYFKPGITYSYLTSGQFSARRLDAGAIFDVAGSSLFPNDVPTMLAILNSSIVRQLLAAINPTVNFQVGDLRELPIPRGSSDALRADVIRAIEITRTLDQSNETSPDFVAPLTSEKTFLDLHRELRDLELRIDKTVAEMYCLPWEETIRPVPIFEQSYTTLDIEGPVQLPHEVAMEFDERHVRLHKRRPRVWVFCDVSRSKFFAVRHDHATRDVVRWIARQLRESIPKDWDRDIDAGIAANIAPLAPILANRQLKKLAQLPLESNHFNRATIASVNCVVVASPPRSRVRDLPSASTAS